MTEATRSKTADRREGRTRRGERGGAAASPWRCVAAIAAFAADCYSIKVETGHRASAEPDITPPTSATPGGPCITGT